jgi:hypothetical protein
MSHGRDPIDLTLKELRYNASACKSYNNKIVKHRLTLKNKIAHYEKAKGEYNNHIKRNPRCDPCRFLHGK